MRQREGYLIPPALISSGVSLEDAEWPGVFS